MSHRDAERAGALGTGCTWLGGSVRTRWMSMADDRAVVMRDGVPVTLRPDPHARALFFNYDRWTGAGMRIVIRDTGRVVRRGREPSETVAWLDLTQGGRTRSYPGRLDCGS